jgi:hypothetical protein
LYKRLFARKPKCTRGYGSRKAAAARLEQLVADVGRQGFHGEQFAKWPETLKRDLVAALHMVALNDVLRYPPLVAAFPSTTDRRHRRIIRKLPHERSAKQYPAG